MLTKKQVSNLNNLLNDCLLTDDDLNEALKIVNDLQNKINKIKFFNKNKENLKNNNNKYFIIDCDISKELKKILENLFNQDKKMLLSLSFNESYLFYEEPLNFNDYYDLIKDLSINKILKIINNYTKI